MILDQVSPASVDLYKPTPSLNSGFPGADRLAQIMANKVPSGCQKTRETRMFWACPRPWLDGSQVLPSSVDLNTPLSKTPA